MSTNTFPDYHNQPLRLTVSEIEDPNLVFDDFFEAYHLPDIRACLQEFLIDALSKETNDAKRHHSTHQNVERLIEAVWQIKHNNKEVSISASETSSTVTVLKEVLGKPPQLIEYVKSNPLFVIREVFKGDGFTFFRDKLRDWLLFSLSAECTVYEEVGSQRRNLFVFHDDLLLLVEALLVVKYQNSDSYSEKDKDYITHAARKLSKDQIENPIQVLVNFFEKYPSIYITRELNDWQSAGISYAGPYTENLSCADDVLETSRQMLCLVKSAEQIIK